MVFFHGQRFRDVNKFRRVVKVFAINEGFNLCVMENRSHVICCECSDLHYDWGIRAEQVLKGMTIIVTEFMPEHKCTRLHQQFHLRLKWISAMYLHRWKQQPKVNK